VHSKLICLRYDIATKKDLKIQIIELDIKEVIKIINLFDKNMIRSRKL